MMGSLNKWLREYKTVDQIHQVLGIVELAEEVVAGGAEAKKKRAIRLASGSMTSGRSSRYSKGAL